MGKVKRPLMTSVSSYLRGQVSEGNKGDYVSKCGASESQDFAQCVSSSR